MALSQHSLAMQAGSRSLYPRSQQQCSSRNAGCRDATAATASRLSVSSSSKTTRLARHAPGSTSSYFSSGDPLPNSFCGSSRLRYSSSSRAAEGSRTLLRPQSGTTVCGVREGRELLVEGTAEAVRPRDVLSRLIASANASASEGGGGWKLVDVRPPWEWERAHVAGSLHVPLFIEDEATDPLTLVKKQIAFGFGGWWLGHRLTKENDDFARDVAKAVGGDKSTPVLLVCNEGLRSLMAVSLLHRAGFRRIAWVSGGFNEGADSHFGPVEGKTELRFAAAGGLQGVIIDVVKQLSPHQQ